MNSFLADTGRKEVDRRLWMQTTNKMEAKAEKTLKGQDKPVTVFNLNSFRDVPLEYPASFADLYEAKVKAKPTPYTHQIKAIEDATAGLKTSDRGQMIMACGTGKTFMVLPPSISGVGQGLLDHLHGQIMPPSQPVWHGLGLWLLGWPWRAKAGLGSLRLLRRN